MLVVVGKSIQLSCQPLLLARGLIELTVAKAVRDLLYLIPMAQEQNNPHDAFFKQYLSQPSMAIDFLRQHLPAEIFDLLDLSQLRMEKDSFVDEKLRSYFSDLIYSTSTRFNSDLRIAFLYEHKSYTDDWVDFQVLRYKLGYWVQEFEQLNAEADKATGQQKRTRTLTPIVVLLVYHGKAAWQVNFRFARHFNGMEDETSPLSQALARYVPAFEPHFINLSTMSDEAIQGEVLTRMMSLVLKHIFEPQLGGRLDAVLKLASEVIDQPSGMAMVLTLLRYIGRAATRIERSELAEKLLTYLPKEGGVLMETMAQEWIKEGEVRGEARGVQIGEARGKLIAQRQIMVQLLHHRFPILTEEEQKKYTAYLAQIDSLDTLTQLVNQLLTAETLAEFEQKLLGYLPKDEAQK